MVPCENHPPEQTTIFCERCGHVLKDGALRTIRIAGFVGRASLNPKMDEFWATGDPEVFAPTPT
jgi:hypothetical protein